jgi:excisionase family DNA binding protein
MTNSRRSAPGLPIAGAPDAIQDSRSAAYREASKGFIDAWPSLLTIIEVAALLRTSRKAVYAMAERAQLPGVTRIGRRLLVRRDDLLSWLDERRAASPGGSRR